MDHRPFSSLWVCAAAMAALTAGPRPEVLRRLIGPAVGKAAWVLVLLERDAKAGLDPQDATLARLVEDKDLAVVSLTPFQTLELWNPWERSSPPRWLLATRNVTTLLEQNGPPTGETVLSAMCSGGYRTVWDRREAFLQEHGDQGEVLDEKLRTSLGILKARLRGRSWRGRVPMAGDDADRIFQETADTLEQVGKLPDWWRLPHLPQLCEVLVNGLAGASPRMRGLMAGLREDARLAWSRNPRAGSSTLGAAWVALEYALEQGQVTFLPDFLAAPGEIWPTRFEVKLLAGRLWVDGAWAALPPFLNSLAASGPGAGSGTAEWRAYVDRQGYDRLLGAVAQGMLGHWKEAEADLLEARRWAGKGWPALVAGVVDALGGNLAQSGSEFQALLTLEPLPDPPDPPSDPPVRMVPGSSAPSRTAWERLPVSEAFLPWGPEELQWGSATKKESEILARWAEGAPVSCGAFRAPDTLLAAWTDLSRPAAMASVLEAVVAPRLTRLGTFIARNPTHLDARKMRATLLRNRMPSPRLEPLLAEDTTTAMIPLITSPGGWAPKPQIWAEPVSRAMPDLEAALRRWPSSSPLWKTWISWAPLHPNLPSPYDFAQSLPVPGARSRVLCRLPNEVHDAVARELHAQERFNEAKNWFQDCWNVLGISIAGLAPEAATARVETIYKHLRNAMQDLGEERNTKILEGQRIALLAQARPQPVNDKALPAKALSPCEQALGLPVPSLVPPPSE